MYELLVFNGSNELQDTVVGFPSVESAEDYATAYCVDGPLGWYYKIVPVK